MQLHPILHRGVRRAGKIGASYGYTASLKLKNPFDFSNSYRKVENKCRKKYDQCKTLHDSYRYPGLTKRYVNAAMVAKNYMLTNQNSWLRQIREAADFDEYQQHEMRIFKTYQDKIDLHELQKWFQNEI